MVAKRTRPESLLTLTLAHWQNCTGPLHRRCGCAEMAPAETRRSVEPGRAEWWERGISRQHARSVNTALTDLSEE
jgi:hypothetical protein